MTLRIDSSRGTIWLDVSLLFACNPHQPTGIPRTVLEILRAWWALRPANLRLCRYHADLRAYTEVPVGKLPVTLVLAQEPNATSPQPMRRFSVRRLVGPLRESALQLLPGVVVWGVRQAKYASWAAVRTAFSVARPACATFINPPLLFGPTDLVVSLGSGWNYPGSGAVVRQLRERMAFRSVHLIHDLIPIKFPQLYRQGFDEVIRDWMANTFRSADLLLTNSRHTRCDVLEFCRSSGLIAPPVEVVRLGEGIAPEQPSGEAPVAKGFDPTRAFVLSVGTLEVRKNHHLLYHVWRQLVQQLGQSAPCLVLAGAAGWLSADVFHQIRNDPLTRDCIIELTSCNNSQLAWLYRHCLFTVFPSLYEGWGLPIAESLAFGKYCIASNTSAMPEVGGDLIGLHEPWDVAGCAKLVLEALDPAFRAKREERIRRHYRPTPWSDTARQIAEHVERHLGPAFRLCATVPANRAA